MIKTESRKAVVQNLEDAGCNCERIEDFLGWYDEGKKEKQLEVLEHQRRDLLERILREERRISCLDYLIYQIQGTATGKKHA